MLSKSKDNFIKRVHYSSEIPEHFIDQHPETSPKDGLLVKLIVFLIRLYQKGLSPFLPPTCRYYPSCSEYTRIAVLRHGSIRGLFLGVWRIVRCNPLSSGGYDPVP